MRGAPGFNVESPVLYNIAFLFFFSPTATYRILPPSLSHMSTRVRVKKMVNDFPDEAIYYEDY